MWSASPTGGTGAEPRGSCSGSGRESVEDQVRPGQVAGRRGLIAPLDDPVGTDDDERPLREAARVVGAERPACLPLRLEVRELLDREPELLPERGLGPGGVA